MLTLQGTIFADLVSAKDALELCQLVQKAIELEHSTIPPYLTALFSIKPGTNKAVADVLHSIVVEEMLHMAIACNITNALGGSPEINKPSFIPNYPTHLPMGVGGRLVVGLEKYSLAQVRNVFMEIEEPEDPIDFPEGSIEADEVDNRTIGEFYVLLKQKILDLPGDTLPGDTAKQFTSSFFSSSLLFPIITQQNAADAIDIIVAQGEGSSSSPLESDSAGFAHYYQFEELFEGRKLVADDSSDTHYSFTGAAIPFDTADIHNCFPNTKARMLPENSEERRNADQFNFVYGKLLNGLHKTFNGEPDAFPHTMGLMYDLKLIGEKLTSTQFPGKTTGITIGPPFEYAGPAIPKLRLGVDDNGVRSSVAWGRQHGDIVVLDAEEVDPDTAFSNTLDIRESDSLRGQADGGPSVTNYIYVRVWNRSTKALFTFVELFYVPYNKIATPADWQQLNDGAGNQRLTIDNIPADGHKFSPKFELTNPIDPLPGSDNKIGFLVALVGGRGPKITMPDINTIHSTARFWQFFLEDDGAHKASFRGLRYTV